MLNIRNMRVEDVETVAKMVALHHDNDPEKGYREAREHTLDHLEIVSQHCYVVENDDKQVIAAMVLHPQDEVFEIEDFHMKEIWRNKEALALLKTKLLRYLENVQTEVPCCPYVQRRLMATY
jgi:DNA-directed RNA polymerase alpha subunit